MIEIVRSTIQRLQLQKAADDLFGDFVKAVIDIERGVMAIGGELHADEEVALLEDGSQQKHLWGINLYLPAGEKVSIEFDSMINVRPSQGNRSRGVEDRSTRETVERIVRRLISEE